MLMSKRIYSVCYSSRKISASEIDRTCLFVAVICLFVIVRNSVVLARLLKVPLIATCNLWRLFPTDVPENKLAP